MLDKRILTASATAMALALSACGQETAEAPVPEDVMTVDDLMLSTEQQARYDAMDRDAMQQEYGEYRDDMAITAVATPSPGMTGAASGDADSMDGSDMDGSGSDASGSDMAGSQDAASGGSSGDGMSGSGGGMATGASGMIPRAQMDFAYLDRNDDGQLSVAEYAIWAVPVDPDEPKRNDALKPYLSDDQINSAGKSFFYYDQDGDTYLSQSEFQTAKSQLG